MANPPNTRAIAAGAIERVAAGGESLSAILSDPATDMPSGDDRAFVQALCFGVCRWYWELEFLLSRLAPKPVKDAYVRSLALVGLYQLKRMRVKPHAAVSETVAAANRSPWAKPFLNALLRSYLRDRERLDFAVAGDAGASVSHPPWLIRWLRNDWPDDFSEILAENNRPPPMSLRVNRLRSTRDAYLAELAVLGVSARPGRCSGEAVLLDDPCPVEKLPGFGEGVVSVQDEAPQLAAGLLQVRAGDRVLDVCAAPGGKTLHLLEACPQLGELLALDVSVQRAALIHANLERAGLRARVVIGDGTTVDDWWDGVSFDRILLDAPCSATGVVRRHPDIKLLRKPADIAALATQQRALLEAVWRTLKPGGMLLYATCSVLRQENDCIIAGFLENQPDARESPLAHASWGRPAAHGRQILPGESEMDGFFYAGLVKAG